MIKNWIYIVCTVSILSLCVSCSTSEPREVVTNDKFSMMIPGYMRSQKSLNNDASMVYANGKRELYVMVLEDSFEMIDKIITDDDSNIELKNNLDGFAYLISNQDGDYFMTYSDLDKLKDGTIQGLEAKLYENIRKIKNIDIYYKVALVKGKSTYYQVITWTLKSRQHKNNDLMNNMINSFQEL